MTDREFLQDCVEFLHMENIALARLVITTIPVNAYEKQKYMDEIEKSFTEAFSVFQKGRWK